MSRPEDPRVSLLAELADPTRLGVLELVEGGPMSATALARSLDVSPTQLANHLRRLRDAGLITVTREGRLAMYQLAEPGLREIFSILNGLRGAPSAATRPAPVASRCYDHLAGELGVALFNQLTARKALEPRDGEGVVALGPRAGRVLKTLGVDPPAERTRRVPAFACLDSHLHRAHLGGHLGAAIASSLTSRGWVRPRGQDRSLEVTTEGRAGLRSLGIRL